MSNKTFEDLKPNGNPASLKGRFQNPWIQSNFARKLTTPSGNSSQERLCNWIVCFKYLGRKICKYLDSNKHFNIVPPAKKLYFKFPSTSEQHPQHNTVLGNYLCQQGLSRLGNLSALNLSKAISHFDLAVQTLMSVGIWHLQLLLN